MTTAEPRPAATPGLGAAHADAADAPLLQVRDLVTSFRTGSGVVTAVRGIDLGIEAGEIVGLVGESGSGKSVTARSIIGLIPMPPGQVQGSVRLEGQELVGLKQKELQKIRGERIAMVFQDPMTSLDPLFTVGEQVAEAIRFHQGLSKQAANAHVVELFTKVGIPRAAERVRSYPHQLSGGMRQRVMIAMAIACGPRLLIADEPTTALDVTIQAQILDLLRSLNRERRMAILLVTHDLGVVAQTCERVMVMYAGRIVEQAPVKPLFRAPLHPYTRGLLASIPDIADRRERLSPIPGSPPYLGARIDGCAFAARCPLVIDRCRVERPELRWLPVADADHLTACHRAEELAGLPATADLAPLIAAAPHPSTASAAAAAPVAPPVTQEEPAP
jgi:peptide/nickel transport system ATP-binding protein